ncbi:hypothetical protein Ocin01_04438 [Orchesella cincta]|uniref:C2H2-type domain-containing protein n=1 Tax=Orchesella cincta TaxID=48709 RepID=A0A1D2NAG4_ORCCI|nr:hypothetical protein Ocin01_04438 [Orchesella cincta]
MAKGKLGRKKWTRKVKSADRKLACSWLGCTKAFRFDFDVKRHEKSHLPKDQRPFLCQPCNLRFAQWDQLRKHQKTPKHARGVALAELANQRGNANPEEEIRQAENGPMEVDINNGVHDNGEEEDHDNGEEEDHDEMDTESDNEVADDEEETEQEESDTEEQEGSDTEEQEGSDTEEQEGSDTEKKEESDTTKEGESASSDKEELGSPEEMELNPPKDKELNLPENEEEAAPDEAEVNSDEDELLDVGWEIFYKHV